MSDYWMGFFDKTKRADLSVDSSRFWTEKVCLHVTFFYPVSFIHTVRFSGVLHIALCDSACEE